MSRRDSTYTIGELADLSGVTPRTIRYYVAQGLLPAGVRSGHQRLYSDEHADRIREIKRLQGQYLPLKVIRRMLAEEEEETLEVRAEMVCEDADIRYMASAEPPAMREPEPRTEPAGRPQDWVRIEIAPGVEIHYQRSEVIGQEYLIDDLVDRARRDLNSEY